MKKVTVIGGGAAGMVAAITAAQNGAEVTLIEKNEKLGKKLYITGKGRCNLTNACDMEVFFNNIETGGKFLRSAVNAFSNEDVCSFFEQAGLKLKEERGQRIFPESDKSSDVIKTLEKELENSGVKVMLNKNIRNIDEVDADAVIIATGGISYRSTGSSGDGYLFAEKLGHKIIKPIPSLVPLIVKERYVKELEGLSLRNVSVKIAKNEDAKPVFEDFGEMLFTDNGVSGPVILSASSIAGRKIDAEPGAYRIFINLKPALSEKQLDARLLRDFDEFKNKAFKNSLTKLLPAKLIPVIVSLSGIDPDKKVNEINRDERKKLLKQIRELGFTIEKADSFEKAVITKGGIDTKEINPKTMESKLKDNVYFAGEVLDVDALTGGFNLQIAFSTGYAAGLAAAAD